MALPVPFTCKSAVLHELQGYVREFESYVLGESIKASTSESAIVLLFVVMWSRRLVSMYVLAYGDSC